MRKTGESYSIAKKHVESQRAGLEGRGAPKASPVARTAMAISDEVRSQYRDIERRTGYPAEALIAASQTIDEAVRCVSVELLPTYLKWPKLHSGSESRLVQDWIDDLLPKQFFTLNESNKKAYRVPTGGLIKFVGNRQSTFDPRLNPTAELCPMLAYNFEVTAPKAGVTQLWFAKPGSMSRALTQTRKGPGTNLARVTFEWVYGLPVVKAEKVALLELLNKRSDQA